MKYHFVVCGRNCESWVTRCLESISSQHDRPFDVCVVDDASDDTTPQLIEEFCGPRGWQYILNSERKGALYNQVYAIRSMSMDPEDPIIIVDMDDYLPHGNVLNALDLRYRQGVMMTYGSYRSEPYSPTCIPASAYPAETIAANAYRQDPSIRWNHLRTFRRSLFDQLDDSDFTYPDGTWLKSAADSAIMYPCLELSRGNFAFIDEPLLVYNSENPSSDWRVQPRQCDHDHHYVMQVLKPKC